MAVSIRDPGIYIFSAKLRAGNGDIHADRVAVLLMDQQQLDALLQVKWNGKKQSLLLNKVDNALVFFLEGSQAVYQKQFELLTDAGVLSQVVNYMGTFRSVEHDGYGIIYDLRTVKDDVEYSFQGLFVQDTDGIWRIKNY